LPDKSIVSERVKKGKKRETAQLPFAEALPKLRADCLVRKKAYILFKGISCQWEKDEAKRSTFHPPTQFQSTDDDDESNHVKRKGR
jgi:hypothetical protein